MSDYDNQPTPPAPSTPKTSAVPLKKETVRITLRARPGEGATQPREATSPISPVTSGASIAPKRATAPIQLPSAPLPPPAAKVATSPVKLPPAPSSIVPPAPSLPVPPPAVRPPSPPVPSVPSSSTPPAAALPGTRPAVPMAPGAPRPPAPMAPSAAPAAPAVAPRPMAPVAPGVPPRIETGATTTPLLKTMPAVRPTAPRAAGTGTAPMAASSGGAPGLPKATVKLQQTQPLSRPSVSAPPSAPVKRTANQDAEQFYNEEKDPEQGLVPLSVVCFLLSTILLVVQMFGSDRISTSDDSSIMVPAPVPVKWETRNEDRTWTNGFNRALPEIPQ